MATVGIHIVFTTYGTWLPGDGRGHWSPLFDVYGRLKRAGHQLNMGDEVTEEVARGKMVEPAKTLDVGERLLLMLQIRKHLRWAGQLAEEQRYTVASKDPGRCRGYVKPVAYALAIESNHVHLLVGAVEEEIGRYVGRLKGEAASALKTMHINRERRHLFTAHYWRVFLFDNEALHAVARYIHAHNARRGHGRDLYDFLTPLPNPD